MWNFTGLDKMHRKKKKREGETERSTFAISIGEFLARGEYWHTDIVVAQIAEWNETAALNSFHRTH